MSRTAAGRERVALPEVREPQPADVADATVVRRAFAGEDVEQRGLAPAVEADDADPVADLDAERDPVEQDPGGVAGDVRGDGLQVDQVPR